MQIELITARVGDGFSQAAGEVIDLPKGEAFRLLNSQQAILPPDAEAAVDEPPENAARRTRRPRRRAKPHIDDCPDPDKNS